MKKIRTRFAPSPTGKLHVGNARTAIVNYLFAKKNHGEFILRIDDTDLSRSTLEYENAILTDLTWLGIKWDDKFNQSSRLDRYKTVASAMIEQGYLYPCFETSEELEVKRKIQLSRGLPPLYDRQALHLTEQQKEKYSEAQGRRAHYRFKMQPQDIKWEDMVKGEISYLPAHLSDPILIREDGSMTYMLCSTIDDIDSEITHVIRGEDHVSNTAIQIQLFEALSASPPVFAHLSLVKAKDDKISKREGGFEIDSLRSNGFEAMAINSFFALIGSTHNVQACSNFDQLIELFDITTYSKSPTTYVPLELEHINSKIIRGYSFADVKTRLDNMNLTHSTDGSSKNIDEIFWNIVRPNLEKIEDIKIWWEICHKFNKNNYVDQNFLEAAAQSLPTDISSKNFSSWTKTISDLTGLKGRDLFLNLRLALTGLDSGPDLKSLCDILSREEISLRLSK